MNYYLKKTLQSFVKKTPIKNWIINYELSEYTATANNEIKSDEDYLELLNKYSKCPNGTALCENYILPSQYDLQIVIPVYNAEKYLRECIDSVIKATTKYKVLIILVDDGSLDNCPIICDEYARIDKRIKVIHKSNGGVGSARNEAIKQIVANYVMFVDSDDRLKYGAIDKLMDIAYSQDADIVQGAFQRLRYGVPTFKDRYSTTGPIEYQKLSGFPCGKVFKGTLFSNVCFPEGFWFEDTVDSFLIFPKSKCSWRLFDVIYEYRVNSTGYTSQVPKSPKHLDTFWVTRLLMKERRGDDYKNDIVYFQRLKKQFLCNEMRLSSAPYNIREAVFSLSSKMLLQIYPQSILPKECSKSDLLFDKIVRDNNYSLFSKIANYM